MSLNDLQFSENKIESRFHEFPLLVNQNNKSFLQNFPKLPLEPTVFGCYETNAQFQYSFSPTFDKNLVLVIIFFKYSLKIQSNKK
jgi:hypothetical protein